MQTKMIPLVLMLSAGGITSIITYIFRYDMKKMLVILLVVLFGFYIVGLIIKKIIDTFEKQNKEKLAAEGEVIEKEILNQKDENTEKIDREAENTEKDIG